MKNSSLGNRVLAFTIDVLFLILITNIFQNIIDADIIRYNFGEVDRYTLSISLFPPLLWFVYFTGCDLIGAASLGKIITNMKLIDQSGKGLSFSQIIIRNLIKSFVSPILLIGFIIAFFDHENLSLHDKVSNTKIVSHKEKALS